MPVYFLAKQIRIRNANAMSSAYIVGFPAITAWLGGVRAVERKLTTENIKFTGVAIVSHDFEIQTRKYRRELHAHIKGALLPLDKADNDGNTKNASFVELATCHATVSLLIKAEGVDDKEKADSLELEIRENLTRNHLAGGTVEDVKEVKTIFLDDDDDERSVLRQLMPGYAIIERRDLLKGGNPLKKMLDTMSVEATYNGSGWDYKRKESGWIVPISVGFKALSNIGTASNTRVPNFKHCLVEPVVTMGEFKMPHRFRRIKDIMWRYSADVDNGMYLCVNQG